VIIKSKDTFDNMTHRSSYAEGPN